MGIATCSLVAFRSSSGHSSRHHEDSDRTLRLGCLRARASEPCRNPRPRWQPRPLHARPRPRDRARGAFRSRVQGRKCPTYCWSGRAGSQVPPPAPAPSEAGSQPPLAGPSGMVYPDGRLVQFSQAEADNTVLVGPSGIVRKDGKNTQLRKKRSTKCLIGPSGVLCPGANPVQFSKHATPVVEGPSGIVFSTGENIQIGSRRKRSLSKCLQGPSGVVCPSGPIQFPANAKLVEAGPSGIVFSTGENIQLPLQE